MEVFVKNDAIERRQMAKEIAKPAALMSLESRARMEQIKSTDSWWRSRVDFTEASKNAKKLSANLERVSPEKLSGPVKDKMWLRARQLKDEFAIGMLSRDELHPVRGFLENGKMVWVVDEEKMRLANSVERNTVWQRKNDRKIMEFKNIMRHLCPEDPNAGDIEKFRPRRKI